MFISLKNADRQPIRWPNCIAGVFSEA